jgi:predicted GNAT family acetyltransferase
LQLETFLDNWRRQGMAEDVMRAALERAKRSSLAMENIGERLKGR